MESGIQDLDCDAQTRLFKDPAQMIDIIKSKIDGDENLRRYKAFYSSEINCITTLQEFMRVNICEKAISRGYFVCTRVQVKEDIVYLNEKHIQLIDDSIAVGLKSPLNHDQISKLINALHKASGLHSCEIFIYITAGIGDQGIYINPENTAVYGVAIELKSKPKSIKLM